ncbi:MAG: N-acetyltransferase, partial [Planctomycetota bacterium]
MPDSCHITVEPVQNRRMMDAFIRFPTDLYRGDPHFVSHLFWERKGFFNADKNPLFDFTDVQYLLATDDSGDVLGRITAHINHRYNDYWDEQTGCFGFFECVPRMKVARTLFEKAESWLIEHNMELVRGPFNFSTNEECGLLVDGYDSPPAIMMPHGKRYYPRMLRRLGYGKAKDLLAFDYDYQGAIPEYLVRFNDRLRQRTGVTIRMLDTNNFSSEIERALRVY